MGCFNLFFTLQALEILAGTISQGHRPWPQLTDVEVIVSVLMGMGAGRISSNSWHQTGNYTKSNLLGKLACG